jgi:hypothetical protein
MTVPTYPGVYIEEVKTTVKVIQGVSTPVTHTVEHTKPSVLIADGYKVLETRIEPGGLSMLFGKGSEYILVRMIDYREGSSTDGHMVVTFAGKLP